MKAVYKNRLMKLYKHLKEGELGQDVFNFGYIHKNVSETSCKTMGCAIGELPYLFKKDFKFTPSQFADMAVCRRGHRGNDLYQDMEEFFGLEYDEYRHLFFPDCQDERFGGELLGTDATRYQVADNILAFLKVKENE